MARDVEGPIHRSILGHLRRLFPSAVIHHSANELPLKGKDVARAIAKAKHNGMVPGFPDLACYLPDGEALFFEVKAKGNSATPAQKSVIAQLQSLGFRAAVVRSVQEVDEALSHWGTTERAASWVPNDYRDLRNRIVGQARGAET